MDTSLNIAGLAGNHVYEVYVEVYSIDPGQNPQVSNKLVRTVFILYMLIVLLDSWYFAGIDRSLFGFIEILMPRNGIFGHTHVVTKYWPVCL